MFSQGADIKTSRSRFEKGEAEPVAGSLRRFARKVRKSPPPSRLVGCAAMPIGPRVRHRLARPAAEAKYVRVRAEAHGSI